MSKLISFFKKFALAVLVLAVGLAALPASGVFAAGLPGRNHSTCQPCLHGNCAWNMSGLVRKLFTSARDTGLPKPTISSPGHRSLIDKANKKAGILPPSRLRWMHLLPSSQLPRLPTDPGAAIIASHNGFKQMAR